MKMIIRRIPCAAAALLAFLAVSLDVVSSFSTTLSSRGQRSQTLASKFIGSSTTTQQTLLFQPVETTTTALRMNGGTNPDVDTDGTGAGKYLLILALLVNVWAFSIPVEFRRARLCSEEDVRLYPERHCTTFEMWKNGIIDYYANGGGVDFDFSVEEGNKWVGS